MGAAVRTDMALEQIGAITIALNQAQQFDEAVHGKDVRALPDGGDLQIITKDGATEQGRALACLTFTVQLPDGSLARAQTVTSVRNLVGAFHALLGRYGHEGKPQLETAEALALDATKGMTPEHRAALIEGMLKVAVHRLGGTFVLGPPESILEAQLALQIGFDAKRLTFRVMTTRA